MEVGVGVGDRRGASRRQVSPSLWWLQEEPGASNSQPRRGRVAVMPCYAVGVV